MTRTASAGDPDLPPTPRPSTAASVVVGLAVLTIVAGLVALGTWQIHRRAWKLALIADVDHRIHAPPVLPPGPDIWRREPLPDYLHVRATGRFLQDKTTLVGASTELGPGFWVIVPLRTDAGFTVLVNRGFIPPDQRRTAERATAGDGGEVTVTGLLRPSEPKGRFLRRNDPAQGRWYSRDVAAIAIARGLGAVAPYFIDADDTPNTGGLPVGGLTVVSFPNNHLVYALTWYALAALLAGASIYLFRESRGTAATSGRTG